MLNTEIDNCMKTKIYNENNLKDEEINDIYTRVINRSQNGNN